ncbi:ribosomal protein L13e [Candidatus Woesearchaeota archaeon]|nr:ribosomal protein L13e [Candidatus Woesearchaeota archaeon]
MKKPLVKSRAKERKGKGFSAGELVEAKVEWTELNRMGIRVDPRRKTVIPKNIETLKDIKKELKPVKEQHKKPKKVQSE